MGFLRHDAQQKYQWVAEQPIDIDIFVEHLYYPLTGCSPAEPVSVYTDGDKSLAKIPK